MSFKLSWGKFDEQFYNNIKTGLNQALNSGPPVPSLTEPLLVQDITLGDNPPQLELLQLDPSKDSYKMSFKILYKGNGLLELRTKVQANPLYLGSTSNVGLDRRDKTMIKKFGMGSAAKPHIIPLSITIKDIEFDGILSVAIINNKIEASFKEDPLKNVNIVTSFDEFPAVATFIKDLVGNQLRDFIMKEFPTIVGTITIPSPSSSPALPYSSPQQSEHSTSFNLNNTNLSLGNSNVNSPILNDNSNNSNNINNNLNDFSLLPSEKLSPDSSSNIDSNEVIKQFKKSKKSNFEQTSTDYIQ